MIINKKILWFLLIVFVSFDNIFSYVAIVNYGMREWNRNTAFFVNISPLFYFVSIPITLLFIYVIIKAVGWIDEKIGKSKKSGREITESILLGSLVIAWGIGVTSFNAATLLRGFSPLGINYRLVLATGILLAVAYGLYAGSKMKSKYKQ